MKGTRVQSGETVEDGWGTRPEYVCLVRPKFPGEEGLLTITAAGGGFGDGRVQSTMRANRPAFVRTLAQVIAQ